jgi:hypothetical protein
VVDAEPGAGPAEPGHHLVDDEEDTVSAADVGDGRPIIVGRNRRSQGGSAHRLGDEGRHVSPGDDLLLE